jgi:hypothetical protein
MTTIPSQCQPLAATLAEQQAELKQITAEYDAATGAAKSRLFYLMRELISAVAQSTQALERCVNPPLPLPDLSAIDFTLRWHVDKTAFDFAVLVHNAGARVSGPFNIVLGVTYTGVFGEVTVAVPATTTIQVGETYTSPFFPNVPYTPNPGASFAADIFYALVDSDDQIEESNKLNNNLTLTKIIKPPKFVLPPIVPVHPPIGKKG